MVRQALVHYVDEATASLLISDLRTDFYSVGDMGLKTL
jgi:hypothetical protein